MIVRVIENLSIQKILQSLYFFNVKARFLLTINFRNKLRNNDRQRIKHLFQFLVKILKSNIKELKKFLSEDELNNIVQNETQVRDTLKSI